MHIVVYGNPCEGFTFVGPFADHEEALKYADDGDGDWWITELSSAPDGQTSLSVVAVPAVAE